MSGDIDDFLIDDDIYSFEGIDEIIQLLKRFSIFKYRLFDNQLVFTAYTNMLAVTGTCT